MKIKIVCNLTGLSDRTIRYYISENLIAPFYTENYLGRKTFDFSEKDIQDLTNIAILRKFGFSIEEIRTLRETPSSSASIISDICHKKSALLKEEQFALQALSSLNDGCEHSIEDIAATLIDYSEKQELPAADTRPTWLQILSDPDQRYYFFIQTVDILLLIAGIGFQIVFTFYSIFEWKFPYTDQFLLAAGYILVRLIPVILVLLWVLIRKNKKNKYPLGTGLLNVLIILFTMLPNIILGIFTPFFSYTTNIDHYLNFDSYVETDDFFNEMFPHIITIHWSGIRPQDVDTHPIYYYQCQAAFDETVDVVAEWTLPKRAFDSEIAQMQEFFETSEKYDSSKNLPDYMAPRYDYTQMQYGDYNCLIRYDISCDLQPFSTCDNNYTFYIFAYNEETHRVRYIYCYSKENGSEQPYYLSLPW